MRVVAEGRGDHPPLWRLAVAKASSPTFAMDGGAGRRWKAPSRMECAKQRDRYYCRAYLHPGIRPSVFRLGWRSDASRGNAIIHQLSHRLTRPQSVSPPPLPTGGGNLFSSLRPAPAKRENTGRAIRPHAAQARLRCRARGDGEVHGRCLPVGNSKAGNPMA